MNTRQLHYLVTIAQLGNLSLAAQALGISQPALSKSLSEWESTYGFSFFLRYRRRLTPTAVGRYFVDSAQKILDEQNRMMLTMRTVIGGDRQNIRLCTAPNRAAIIYSHIYNSFSRRYPDISLSLTERYASEQPTAISRGQVDLALGAGPVTDTVEDIPFAREELLVSLPISHPLAKRKRLRLEELRDTPFVLQGRHHSIRAIADRLFTEAGFQPVVSFESNDVLLLDSMMHQAVGAGLVSKIHVFPCDELRYLPLDPPVYQLTHIRSPKGHTLTEAERYLAGLLIRQRLADQRYEPIRSPQADELLAFAEATEQSPPSGPPRAAGGGDREAGEVSLDTHVLEYLIAIVEERSLSKAADRFYLAQPALSRHLRNVEQMVGLPLFTREHNRLRPTNAGKIFVNGARNILLTEHEMESYIKAYRAGHGGRLFLHCDPALAPVFRERVAPSFALRHPDVELALVESNCEDTREALLNASTDLGLFLTCSPSHPLLKNHILGLTELVYCADAGRPLPGLRGGDPLSPPLGRRDLMLAPTGTTLRGEQERLIEGLYTEPPQVVCQAEFSLLQKLSALGGADAILPLHMLPSREWSHCYSLQPPQPYYLVLAYNPSRRLPQSAPALAELIRTVFASWPEDLLQGD